jgi:phosphoglycerate dehydrogenase-like enzyme
MLVAERLSGFGMRIQTVTEDNFPLISFVEKRWLADQLQEALPPADVVIMCAPYTKSSKKMMGREAFAAMKNGAYFVNVSRGGPVDTEALLDALNSGHVAGAGLDVTDPEPLPSDHPFFTMPNVLHSPHLAGISDNLRERNLELVSTNIRRFVKGLPLINVVDKALGY